MKPPTPITLPSGSYLLIEVPEDAKEIVVFDNITERFLSWYDGDDPPHPDHGKALPSGNWELIGKGDQLSDEIIEGIIGEWKKCYYTEDDWIRGYPSYDKEYECYETAKESLVSLLTHHGYKPETTVILKQVI